MSAPNNMPHSATPAGIPAGAQNPLPKVDLSAGLLPKKKGGSKIDLSAGLVPKDDGAVSGGLSGPASAPAARRPARNQPAPEEASARREERNTREHGNDSWAAHPPAPKPINPMRDVVRRAASASAENLSQTAHKPPSEPRVLAVDGTPQGTWQSPPIRPVAPQNQSEEKLSDRRPPQADQDLRTGPFQPQADPESQSSSASRSTSPARERFASQTSAHDATRPDDPPLEPLVTGLSVPQPAVADTQVNAAARMTGLKNLIQSLGLKNPPRPAEFVEPPMQHVPPVEPVSPRPVYGRATPASAPAPSWKNEPSPSPTLVTAPPEFLPPKPLVEKSEKEHSASASGTSRRDRRETYDDVEILPSWRGQYRRK